VGTITLPATGPVYLDANALIYSVETHPTFWPLLQPVWNAAKTGAVQFATSELSILECLVIPYRINNRTLIAAYERVFASIRFTILPISQPVLREAARLRATINKLRSPDAIHAATALLHPVGLFLTNDDAFRKVPGLPVTVLSHLLTP
jgi:predicted nucleic acid-binding protein